MDIYNYHPVTREFISQSKADISPLEPDVYLIPALATTIVPPTAAEHEVAVFDTSSDEWTIVSDFRNVDLWDKSTAAKVTASIGKSPDDMNATQLEPTTDYPKWDEGSGTWGTDDAAQLSAITATAIAKVEKLLTTATDKIAPLQDAVDLGIATEDETTALAAWKNYRVLVNRVTTQSGYPTTIDWPPVPE